MLWNGTIGGQTVNVENKECIVVVQCHIVRQRCPGYYCEQAFTKRVGGFAIYPKNKNYRKITLTCGGCCGRTLHRKLTLLKLTLAKKENLDKDQIMVHLSSCITKDNYHAPPCPHLDYIKALIAKIGIDVCEDTVISEKSEQPVR